MGERASIKVTHGDEGHIWMYAHWSGAEIVEITADALQRVRSAGRMNDPSYATRIIFDTLTGCRGDDLGFGIFIGGEEPDSNYDCPEIRWGSEWGKDPTVIYREREMDVDSFISASSVLTG